SRPADIVRILTINGVPADSLSPTAVADSFRIRLRLTTADGGQPTSRVFLVDRRGSTDTHIGRLSRGFAPGTTTDTVFTAYVARPGSYTIRAYTSVDTTLKTVYSPHYPVVVVQSDVTPPVITPISPVDGGTVATARPDITWDMSDNRAIWTRGIEVNWNPGTNGCTSSGTVIPGALDVGVQRVSMRNCTLVAGPNAITIFVIDASGNRATRSMVVNYVP
ncbi:MAG TPA: hypothetical protein VE913_10560, partial [Longimicrobium sp.]|nr:hypothetical protein [Longimicrobium sp.]